MYDIRQFKPSLYLLLALGLSGFALAAEEPLIWVLSMAGLLLNAALVASGRFKPMPRWLSNIITLLAMIYVIDQVWSSPAQAILSIGQLLVFFHLVKLFEQRANRDYALLLVLSFLLMVAAAINTASLLFGIMLAAYVFLYLYTCLLFHLKAETDGARAAQTLPEKVHAATLRQDQRYLSRSMRRLTVMVAVCSLTMAVVVFVLVPRGAGSGYFGQLQFHPPETLTGFSETPSFQDVARIQQNNTIVAHVKVSKNGVPVRTGTLMLRGTTFDRYSDGSVPDEAPWRWSRGNTDPPRDIPIGAHDIGTSQLFTEPAVVKERWHQSITLEPIGSRLFALGGVISFEPSRDVKIRYSQSDQSLALAEAPMTAFHYEVESSGVLAPQHDPDAGLGSRISPAIAQLARSPEILKGLDPANPANYPQIATNIETWLKHNFTYTLDLTDARQILHEGDPIAVFLTKVKRGHCEYFAGAMTLMCQSLGIPARYVVGFKCNEYSSLGDYFIVRQSHAHAWVEVLTRAGWETFDPTSGHEAPRRQSAWDQARLFIDFIQYKWASSVVAYDNNHRDNLLAEMNTRMQNSANNTPLLFRDMRRFFHRMTRWTEDAKILSALVFLTILAGVIVIAWFVLERWRIRRRAARIGLDNLPMGDRLRLARQLGFYLELTQLLERKGISRSPHLTPREFGDSLAFLPNEAYILVRRLTRIFYRIRYGRLDLRHSQQRRLSLVVGRLGRILEPNAKDR